MQQKEQALGLARHGRDGPLSGSLHESDIPPHEEAHVEAKDPIVPPAASTPGPRNDSNFKALLVGLRSSPWAQR